MRADFELLRLAETDGKSFRRWNVGLCFSGIAVSGAFMSRYDFVDLRIFITLAKLGNLTAASKVLPFTPSALSLRLKKLEDALNVKLFRREARGLALTAAGAALRRPAQEVLDKIARLDTTMAGFQKTERVPLRIGSNSAGLQSILLPATGRFLADHGVRFVFEELRSFESVDALRAGTIDLAFGLEKTFREAGGFEIVPILEDRHVIIAPETHPLVRNAAVAGKTSLDFAEMLDYPFLSLSVSLPFGSAMKERTMKLGRSFQPIAEVPTFALVIQLVMDGAGVAALPYSALFGKGVLEKGLKALPINDDWAHRPLAIAFPKPRGEDDAVAAFKISNAFALHVQSYWQLTDRERY